MLIIILNSFTSIKNKCEVGSKIFKKVCKQKFESEIFLSGCSYI